MIWFNTKAQREELRELRQVADRVKRAVDRVYPGSGKGSPVYAIATLEVWITERLFEKAQPT